MNAEVTALSGSDHEQHRQEALRSVEAAIEQIKLGDYIGAAMTFTWLSRHLHRLK